MTVLGIIGWITCLALLIALLAWLPGWVRSWHDDGGSDE